MIVFPMAQDPARENLAITIVHIGDDAIFVAANVEHSIGRNVVRATEALPQIGEINKARMLGDGVPVAQRLFGFWVFLPEFAQHLQRDDVHD